MTEIKPLAATCRFLNRLALLILFVSTPGIAEQEKTAETASDPWQPLRLLEGSWQGKIDGIQGPGESVRRYEFALGGHFLTSKNVSMFPPHDGLPNGDYHQDMGFFSYDRENRRLVLRELMVEGYTVRSICEVDGRRVICNSQEVENGSGIESRTTLEIKDRFHFRETYELKFPGREMKVFFRTEWRRAPDLRDLAGNAPARQP